MIHTVAHRRNKNPYSHYSKLFCSPYLEKVEVLTIDQTNLTLNSPIFQSLGKECFPALKYIELPKSNISLGDLLWIDEGEGEEEWDPDEWHIFNL